MLIAVQMLFGDGLALSVCFADTSPKGRGFGSPQCFLYLFAEVYGILVLRFIPPILWEGRWILWCIYSQFWSLSQQM